MAEYNEIKTDSIISANIIKPEPDHWERTKESPDEIIKAYGVNLHYPLTRGPIEVSPDFIVMVNRITEPTLKGKDLPKDWKEKIERVISEQLIKYPRDFFRKYGICDIHFTSLYYDQGYFGPYTGYLIFDLESPQVFHHEIHHFLEFRTREGRRFKKEWDKAFPKLTLLKRLLFILTRRIHPNQQFYSGRKWLRSTDYNSYFASRNGSSSPLEDRAEFASKLFTNPPSIEIDLKSSTPLIRKKLEYTMSFYYNLDKRMGVAYWAHLFLGEVDSNYWRYVNDYSRKSLVWYDS